MIKKVLTVCFLIGSLSLLSVLTACKSNQERSSSELSVALGSPPFSLSPTKSTDATGMRLVSLLYQGLVRIGPDLKPQPDLASSWTVKGSVYNFKIPNDVLFSDGSPLKCANLLDSVTAFQDKKSPFNSVFRKIKNTTCLNEGELLSFSFNLPSPSAKFLLADLPVLKIFKDNIGSGPFILKENTPSFSILSPNTYFKNKQSYSLKIEYLKDDFARFLKVYKGESDIAPNSIPFEKINSFANSSFKVIEKPSLSTSYLLLNFKNKTLSDFNFRKYIYSNLGIKDLIVNRFENHVTLSKSLLSPDHPYFSKDLLLTEHTSSETKPPSSTSKLLTIKTSNARQSIETGKILAQRLREKGIPVRLQSFEWGTFYRDVKSGNYDLALMKWVGVVDPDQYNIAFHSSEFPPGRNRGYYANKDLDKDLDEARKAFEFNKRSSLYNKVQDHVFKNLAIIPLWHENQIHIVHPRIENYKVNPMGDFSSFLNLKISNKNLKE